MLMKVHDTDRGTVVAVCDMDILGKRFEENGVILQVTRDFFGGERASPKEVAEAIGKCITANIVGKKAVEVLIRDNVVNPESVITVSGQKHAQIFRV